MMQFDTTPLEYLEMADLAYKDEDWWSTAAHQQLLAKGWQAHTSSTQVSFLKTGQGGYRGLVYIHQARKEIVCAHRGTSSLAAIKADITLLIEEKIHAQITAAIETCLDAAVRKLLSQNYSLTFTGHSLGGFLATASLYFCQRTDLFNDRGESLHYANSKAVVFDPAGSQVFLTLLEPYAMSHTGLGTERIKSLNSLHFVSLPNYINAYAPHPGGTIYALFPQHIEHNTLNPITYLQQTHSLSQLRSCFVSLDSDDPRAGYPKVEQCRKMNDWPLIDFTELASLGTVLGAMSAPLKLGLDVLQSLATVAGHHYQRIPYCQRLGGGEGYQQALHLAMMAAKTQGKIAMPKLISSLNSHYIAQRAPYDAQLHQLHFGKDLSQFLLDYTHYLQGSADAMLFARDHRLNKISAALLENYRINATGELSLLDPTISVFNFRCSVAKLLIEKKLTSTSVKNWINQQRAHLPQTIKNIKNCLKRLEKISKQQNLKFFNLNEVGAAGATKKPEDRPYAATSTTRLILRFSDRYPSAPEEKNLDFPRSGIKCRFV